MPGQGPFGLHRLAPLRQLLVRDPQIDASIGNIDGNEVALRHQANGPTPGGLRGHMTDGQARGATGKAPIRNEGTSLAKPLGFEIAGRIEHFLHAGATHGAFVADQNHITLPDLVGQNGFDRIFLAFEDAGWPGKGQD